MDPFGIVLGTILLVAGIFLVFVAMVDREVQVGLLGGIALGLAILVLVVTATDTQCETESTVPFVVTVKDQPYSVTKVTICDDDTVEFKGSKPQADDKLVKVDVK